MQQQVEAAPQGNQTLSVQAGHQPANSSSLSSQYVSVNLYSPSAAQQAQSLPTVQQQAQASARPEAWHKSLPKDDAKENKIRFIKWPKSHLGIIIISLVIMVVWIYMLIISLYNHGSFYFAYCNANKGYYSCENGDYKFECGDYGCDDNNDPCWSVNESECAQYNANSMAIFFGRIILVLIAVWYIVKLLKNLLAGIDLPKAIPVEKQGIQLIHAKFTY